MKIIYKIDLNQDCGGQGICEVKNSSNNAGSVPQCECEENFYGAADFVDTSGLDCQINSIGIRFLWGLNILMCAIIVYVSAPIIIARIENFLETKKSIKGYNLWRNKGLCKLFLYYYCCF